MTTTKEEQIRVPLHKTANQVKKEMLFLRHLDAIPNKNLEVIIVPPRQFTQGSFRHLADLSPAILLALSDVEKERALRKEKPRYYMKWMEKYWKRHHCLPKEVKMTKHDFRIFDESLEDGILLQHSSAMNIEVYSDIEPYFWSDELDLYQRYVKNDLNSNLDQ